MISDAMGRPYCVVRLLQSNLQITIGSVIANLTVIPRLSLNLG
jgi:hypothetical protein